MITRTWVLLVTLTLGSAVFAELTDNRVLMLLTIFGVAIGKGHVVAARFMETTHARPAWRTLYHSWIVVIGLLLLAGNLLAPAA